MKRISAKVVILGDSGVGKTSCVNRFVRETFDVEECATVGAGFLTKAVDVGSTRVVLHIWDTAGQERYRSLGPLYYRNAAVAVVVYDVCKPKSVAGAKRWVHDLRAYHGSTIDIVLVGNKIDLLLVDSGMQSMQSGGCVDAATSLADLTGCVQRQVSAKSGEGVQELFEYAATLAQARRVAQADALAMSPVRPPASYCCDYGRWSGM